MKKLLILCALLLAALLSGCAAEPSQGQTAGNTSKAPTPQEETPASFEPVSTDSSAHTKAPTEAADPAACIPNEDKHDSSPSFSSEPVSAPTESNAPTPEEDRQAPVLPEKPEKAESPKEEPSVPAITEPEPTPETEPAFDIEHWISYAKSTAVSLGLTLDSSASDCWDNPITAKPTCIYLERDINSRLNRYAKEGGDNCCLDLVRMRRHKQLPDLYRVRISINKSIHRNEHRGSTVLFSCLEGGQNE